MPSVTIRPLAAEDRDWVRAHVAELWGAPLIVVHGVSYYPETLPGFLAVEEDEPAGLLTYQLDGGNCEIVTLDSLRPGRGIGTALIDAVREVAREAGCERLWLITTNDNLHALRFYQKRGFVLVAVHRDAMTRSRLIKPQISLLGDDGIPIRDEIELEMPLV